MVVAALEPRVLGGGQCGYGWNSGCWVEDSAVAAALELGVSGGGQCSCGLTGTRGVRRRTVQSTARKPSSGVGR